MCEVQSTALGMIRENRVSKTFKTIVVAAAIVSATIPTMSDEQMEKRFPESQYRHDIMEMSKLSLASLIQHFKGEANHEGHIPEFAAVMAKSAAMSKAAFSVDTRNKEGHTEAKANIWDNWDDFAARMDKYEADTAAFAVAAKSGDANTIRAAFGKTVKNCKSCHDEYRK